MLKKLTSALAFTALAMTAVSFDDDYRYSGYNNGVENTMICVDVKAPKLLDMGLGLGFRFDTMSPITVGLDLGLTLKPALADLGTTIQSPIFLDNVELNMRMYNNEDKTMGLFYTFGVGVDFEAAHSVDNGVVTVLSSKGTAVTDTEGAGLSMGIYGSFGIGHVCPLASFMSLSNRVYIKKSLMKTSGLEAEDTAAIKAAKAAGADAQALNNFLSTVRFELFRLEFAIY